MIIKNQSKAQHTIKIKEMIYKHGKYNTKAKNIEYLKIMFLKNKITKIENCKILLRNEFIS